MLNVRMFASTGRAQTEQISLNSSRSVTSVDTRRRVDCQCLFYGMAPTSAGAGDRPLAASSPPSVRLLPHLHHRKGSRGRGEYWRAQLRPQRMAPGNEKKARIAAHGNHSFAKNRNKFHTTRVGEHSQIVSVCSAGLRQRRRHRRARGGKA